MTPHQDANTERLLWVLSAATFVIFFQAFMVAPIIPRLSEVFGTTPQEVGLIVPAYLIPYGGDDPISWLRYDTAAVRRHRHIAEWAAARASDGIERLHAFRRLRAG